MTQPRFAPITLEDEVRPILKLKAPEPWRAHRPSEFTKDDDMSARGRGVPGPDQGYALSLAERFSSRLHLAADEHKEDVVTASVAVALHRAMLYGRAPVSADLELAFAIFGFLDDAPADLVAFRAVLAGASHDSWKEREIAQLVTEETLRQRPADVRSRLSDWRSFFAA